MMRFSRPGIILDRFSLQRVKTLGYDCSMLSGFIGMVRGSNPSLASTGPFYEAPLIAILQITSEF
jgi:hypothetical protein